MNPVKQALRTRAPSKDDMLEMLTREIIPVLAATRDLTNRLAANPEDADSSGTAVTIDWSSAHYRVLRLTANATLDFTEPPQSALLVLRVVQDGTGGWAPTWPSTVRWMGGTAPTITVAPGAVDIVVFYCDGAAFYGMPFQDFQ